MIQLDDDTWLNPGTIHDLRVSVHRPEPGSAVVSVKLRAQTATVVWTFPTCRTEHTAEITHRARDLAALVAEQISAAHSSVGIVSLRKQALDPRGVKSYPNAQVFAVT